MKKSKTAFYSSFKGSVPVEIRDKKDFCKLVKKDRSLAEEFFTIMLTPYAYDYTENKSIKPDAVKTVVKKAMKKSWKKIDEFKENDEETLEEWCEKFLDKELKKVN